MKHIGFLLFASLGGFCAAADLASDAEECLSKAVKYFHSINSNGGYVYYVTPDLSQRWGESPADDNTIEVQPPGTPAVGMSFLRVWQVTGDETALEAAKDAADALLKGQNALGGWEHTIRFDKPLGKTVSFDDDQTQSAISFLMALDQEIEDPKLKFGIRNALDLMIESQLEHGGWPHKYPWQGNYHDYATFNDGGINDCLRVMMEAYKFYGGEEIRTSLVKGARFMLISQLPPPQPGWAQQYNEYLQPAWARSFEPPSVCPAVTVKNINTLIDLYLVLGNRTYLEAIPDALRWLESIQLENGKWARFVEIGTGKPLYYDRGRIRVDTLDELHPERRTGYAYQTDLSKALLATNSRYQLALDLGHKGLSELENASLEGEKALKRLQALSNEVMRIIESQDESGAWITKNDRFKKTMPRNIRWNGQYEVRDRISSAVFIKNVGVLSEFIKLKRELSDSDLN
ncbi:MAG: pectate lyase [Puniceicoccaceae bacterium]